MAAASHDRASAAGSAGGGALHVAPPQAAGPAVQAAAAPVVQAAPGPAALPAPLAGMVPPVGPPALPPWWAQFSAEQELLQHLYHVHQQLQQPASYQAWLHQKEVVENLVLLLAGLPQAGAP